MQRCRVDEATTVCRGVRIELEDWMIRASQVQLGEELVRVRGLRASPADAAWTIFVERGEFSGEKRLLSEVAIVDGSVDAFRASEVRYGIDSGGGIRMREARWGSTASGTDRTAAPASVPELSRVDLRASSLHYGPDGWEVRNFRQATPPGLPLGRSRGRRPAPASGLLAPRGTYSEGEVELGQRALYGPARVGALLSATPGAWYGLGPFVLTEPAREWYSVAPREPEMLDATFLFDQERNQPGWSAVGSARRGSPSLHVSGRLEEMSSERTWRTRRLRQPGILRPWRRSALGLSLSSPSHHLQIRGAKWSPSPVRLDRNESSEIVGGHLPGDQAELRLRFGASHRISEGVEFSTDVFHRNAARAELADDHGTTFIGGLTGRIGETSRLFAEGRLGSVVGTRLAAPTRAETSGGGFDAAGITQLVGGLRAGATIRGSFPGSTHLIRPTLTAYREILGGGPTRDLSQPFGAPFSRRSNWTLLSGVVDQSLEWSDLRVEFPIGFLAEGAGASGGFWDRPYAFHRTEFQWSHLHVGGGAAAPVDGSSWMFFGRTQLFWADWSAALDATTLDSPGLAALHADRILGRTAGALRLLQGQMPFGGAAEDRAPGTIVESLSFSWAPRSVRVELVGLAREALEPAGFGGGWTWTFPRLGWGVGVDGMYATAGRGWGISAGLETARP